MKKQEEKEERFKEILDDACNMHMLKNVLYIKSRFSFSEGFMYRQSELDKSEEKIKSLLKERDELIDSRNKIAAELFDLKKISDAMSSDLLPHTQFCDGVYDSLDSYYKFIEKLNENKK